jgi:hypothetical protein
MSKVVRAELAVWPSVAKGLKQWVAQTEATVARVAISGLLLIATLHRFWLFVITRTVARKTVFTAKEKTFTDDVARI